MTTFLKPVDEAVTCIMNATRPFTKKELERLFGEVYNAGYDEGREVGYEAALIDVSMEEDEE
jgi:hypothetical protein